MAVGMAVKTIAQLSGLEQVTEEPKPTIWRKLVTQDEYGWEG
jgi:hypothetical protein